MEKILTESEKVEQLMRPRYKVIADYPGSDYSIGEVLVLDDGGGESDEFYFCDEDGKHIEWEAFYKHYPHIFKPLEWWEERAPEEIPGYVKFAKENSYGHFGEVIKIDEIKISKGGFGIVCHDKGTWWATDCLPATESKYNEYLTASRP